MYYYVKWIRKCSFFYFGMSFRFSYNRTGSMTSFSSMFGIGTTANVLTCLRSVILFWVNAFVVLYLLYGETTYGLCLHRAVMDGKCEIKHYENNHTFTVRRSCINYVMFGVSGVTMQTHTTALSRSRHLCKKNFKRCYLITFISPDKHLIDIFLLNSLPSRKRSPHVSACLLSK